MKEPLRATYHCRHYSYDGKPTCALGVDLSAPVSALKCLPMPAKNRVCTLREEYTNEERRLWDEFVSKRLDMSIQSVLSISSPVYPGSSGQIDCIHCDGKFSWSRARNGHVMFECSTPSCVGLTHLNIDPKTEWPPKMTGEDHAEGSEASS